MKTLPVLVLLSLAACAADPGDPIKVQPPPPHTAYSCTAPVGADAGACITDFRNGTGSDCVYTCDRNWCQIVRASDSGFVNVATCVAP